MKNFLKSEPMAIGLAMFSMFFGAGNIIYPLAVGLYAGDKNFYAIFGLILTAVFMPVIGVVAMILYNGSYRDFFGKLGKIPGFLVALLMISLLGPLGSTPRCIALAYTTLSSVLPDISPTIFSASTCVLIFLLTFKKTRILSILGWGLTPLLLFSLVSIIVIGFIEAPAAQVVESPISSMFFYGLSEGYNTMDLLAAFFFSSTVIGLLKARSNPSDYGIMDLKIPLKASLVAGCLLTCIYIGFSYIASYHGADLQIAGKDELLAAITLKIAGPYAGMLVCVTVALACLTTAVALITAFADFMQKEVFNAAVSYESILVASLLLTFFISTYEFTQISAFLWPILQVCYPGLIALTAINIISYLRGYKVVECR